MNVFNALRRLSVPPFTFPTRPLLVAWDDLTPQQTSDLTGVYGHLPYVLLEQLTPVTTQQRAQGAVTRRATVRVHVMQPHDLSSEPDLTLINAVYQAVLLGVRGVVTEDPQGRAIVPGSVNAEEVFWPRKASYERFSGLHGLLEITHLYHN